MRLVYLLRKPFDQPLTRHVGDTGLGGLNIDGTRIPQDESERPLRTNSKTSETSLSQRVYNNTYRGVQTAQTEGQKLGRWPANFILEHHPECVPTEELKRTKGYAINTFTDGMKPFGKGAGHDYQSNQISGGTTRIWKCHPECPVEAIDAKLEEPRSICFYRITAQNKEKES